MTVAPSAIRPAAWAAAATAALSAGLTGCTIYSDCPVVYEPAAVVVDQPPPKVWEPVGDVPTKPAADAVWVDGHYDWDNGQQRWVWIDGHWETGRAGQTWTDPRAVRTQGGYEYHPGYWRPADTEPSGVYRRESDVRLSARASASVRFGGNGGSTTDGDGRGDAVRRQSGDVDSRPRGDATSGGTTAGGSGGDGEVRVRGVSSARTGGSGQNGGDGDATTTRGSGRATLDPGTRADAPARTGGGTTTATTASPAGTRPTGGTTTATARPAGASGRGSGTTTTTTDPAGARGGTDAPVVPNVASGPIRCTLENRLTVRNGAIEATLENVVTRPRFMAGEPLVVTARQGDGWERVRLRVPLEPGTWDVRVSTSDGRSADCGFLRVLGP